MVVAADDADAGVVVVDDAAGGDVDVDDVVEDDVGGDEYILVAYNVLVLLRRTRDKPVEFYLLVVQDEAEVVEMSSPPEMVSLKTGGQQ